MKALRWFARQSPALIVAMIALFVALTGTAVATTSALITGAQIKNNSITGLDVKNRSLTPRDFRGSVRGPRGPAGPPGAAGAAGAQGAQGPPGASTDDRPGRSVNTGCTADGSGGTFVNCGSAAVISVPRAGRALAVVNIAWYTFGASPARGECRLVVDGGVLGPTVSMGEVSNNTDSLHKNGVGITQVTGELAPGNHSFQVQCNNPEGDVDFSPVTVSAVNLGPA
jgi:hypothetical protein